MQCNNPFYRYPLYAYNNPQYGVTGGLCNSVTTPEIIGEGEVTSLLCPDGSSQYFFLPHNFGPGPYIYRNNSIWLIRSPSNLLFNCQQPNMLAPSYLCNTPVKPPIDVSFSGYQLKFHNDGWTSTTDLHYFFPCLRQCEWIPKLGASVQVELPTETAHIYHYQMLCQKPCNCANTRLETRPCESVMSIDDDRGINKNTDCNCKQETKGKNIHKTNSKCKLSHLTCRCKESHGEIECKCKETHTKRSSSNVREKRSKIDCQCNLHTDRCKKCRSTENTSQKKLEKNRQKYTSSDCDECSHKNDKVPYCECSHKNDKDPYHVRSHKNAKVPYCECSYNNDKSLKKNKKSDMKFDSNTSLNLSKAKEAQSNKDIKSKNKKDKKIATFTDQSSSYSCDEICGTSPLACLSRTLASFLPDFSESNSSCTCCRD